MRKGGAGLATKKFFKQDGEIVALPPHDDELTLANTMGSLFVKKIDDIGLELDNAAQSCPVSANYDFIDLWQQCCLNLDDSDVENLVKSSSKKFCSLDPMPASLMARCMDELLPVLKQMINLSLQTPSFADSYNNNNNNNEGLFKYSLQQS